ncbi:hypothetical protein A2Z67_03885 [Candidatus Woesebacteria bacterium RBG_13_36_22]|uniref:5'-3' exonuclease domain-containing protein n=1 Tax=Candidatus Woesebacteria bacterium RBG_13_36_22 TaxID=1802478 RepID=A0A1F7X0B6_9BACT|nr:MAG: hypothetical protein A2Z67_03885 [Candidatus Woesebacteria bacterium RBG_13_36_22]
MLMRFDVAILDGNHFAWRAAYVLDLRTKGGKNTSILFGVLNMVRSILENDAIDESICICWDGGHKKKDEAYPDYKKGRVRNEAAYSEMIQQIRELNKALPFFGVKQVQGSIEADDAIYFLCEDLSSKGKKVLVISGDRDMFQLVNQNVTVLYTPNKDKYITPENFEEVAEIPSNLFLFYRTIIGDTSDNITGLPGFGPVTAKRLLTNFGPWPDWFEDNWRINEKILSSKMSNAQRKVLSDSSSLEILVRNYSLMKMGFLDIGVKEEIVNSFYSQDPEFNEEVIKEYFLENQFNNFLNRFHWFTRPFHKLFLNSHNRSF